MKLSTISDSKPSNLVRPRVQADIEQNLNMSLGQRVSAAVLGVKGSFLRQDQNAQNKNENPVARLRLLLVRYICQKKNCRDSGDARSRFLPSSRSTCSTSAQPSRLPLPSNATTITLLRGLCTCSASLFRGRCGHHIPHHFQRPLHPG